MGLINKDSNNSKAIELIKKALELKLFEVKTTTINNPDGSVRVTKTTKVTPKGQKYLINKFLHKINIVENQ